MLTRDPVADRIDSLVVAVLTRTRRGIISELPLTARHDGVPSNSVVNFDAVHTVPRSAFQRRVTQMSAKRLEEACETLKTATGC